MSSWQNAPSISRSRSPGLPRTMPGAWWLRSMPLDGRQPHDVEHQPGIVDALDVAGDDVLGIAGRIDADMPGTELRELPQIAVPTGLFEPNCPELGADIHERSSKYYDLSK